MLHLQLVPQTADRVELRLWSRDPANPLHRSLELGEIADLTAIAEADYYSQTAPDLLDVGRRLYRWLDGPDRQLSRQLDELRGGDPIALAVNAGDLGHLPWETLHDGATFLTAAADAPVIPVRWRPGPEPAQPENRALNALIMTHRK